MPTSDLHKEAPLTEIHRAHNWEYASSSVREAATGFAALDVNKLALQLDDYSLWLLTTNSPAAWRKIAPEALYDNRGLYAASSNLFPAAGGSGVAGAVKADDVWYASSTGTLGGTSVSVDDAIRALIDAPLQVAPSWEIIGNNEDRLGNQTVIRDSANGVVGKTSGMINILNVARTFKNTLASYSTAIRAYTLPNHAGDILVGGEFPVIASATSTVLLASLSAEVNISGTTTITGFGAAPVNTYRYGMFTGALVLTHNSTSLILPGGSNINVKAGDRYIAIALAGASDWKVLSHRPVNGDVPAGTIIDYAGSAVPDGYLACDGQNIARAGVYANLFSYISTTYGVGDGSSTFTLPDLRRRVSVGEGGTGTSVLASALGSYGGTETHTLITSEMPAHTHTKATGQSHSNDPEAGTVMTTGNASNTLVSGSTGGGAAHNNMQPSIVVQKLIRY